MTYPWPTLMPMGIVVILCIRPSVQPSMGLGLCIALVLHTKCLEEMAYNLACWCIQMAYTQHSWMLMDIVVGLSVRPSVRLFVYTCPTIWVFSFFFLFFSKVRVGAKEGGSHYWKMAVAITCGYGGYLLPLLAAHSSLKTDYICTQLHKSLFWIPRPSLSQVSQLF